MKKASCKQTVNFIKRLMFLFFGHWLSTLPCLCPVRLIIWLLGFLAFTDIITPHHVSRCQEVTKTMKNRFAATNAKQSQFVSPHTFFSFSSLSFFFVHPIAKNKKAALWKRVGPRGSDWTRWAEGKQKNCTSEGTEVGALQHGANAPSPSCQGPQFPFTT